MSKTPAWVMCGVCSEVMYGGPSSFGIPRFCDGWIPPPPGADLEQTTKVKCRATCIVTTKKGPSVRWDKAAYLAAGVEEPEVEWSDQAQPNLSRAAVEETTLDSFVEQHLTILSEGGEV